MIPECNFTTEFVNVISRQNFVNVILRQNFVNVISRQNFWNLISRKNLVNVISRKNFVNVISRENFVNVISRQNFVNVFSRKNFVNVISRKNFVNVISQQNFENVVSRQKALKQDWWCFELSWRNNKIVCAYKTELVYFAVYIVYIVAIHFECNIDRQLLHSILPSRFILGESSGIMYIQSQHLTFLFNHVHSSLLRPPSTFLSVNISLHGHFKDI